MIDYTAKLALAPMVRIGELPFRLLALRYGADLVWGPEVIDKKIIQCERVYNDKLGTVDFIYRKGVKSPSDPGEVVFRTYRKVEKDRLIFQMGTADPKLAVQAAKVVVEDVDGIDINAGCPKHFSIQGGMGAALLRTPDLLCDILTSLVENVGKPNNKPISVKIRLLEEKQETLDLVSRLAKTGIRNLTVHCRTRNMRNREKPIQDYVSEIADICAKNDVSFLINGHVTSYADYKQLQEKFGDNVGAMVATAGQDNPSCFCKDGPKSWLDVSRQYMDLSLQYDNHAANSKYALLRMIPGKHPVYQEITRSKTLDQFQEALGKVESPEWRKRKIGGPDATTTVEKRIRLQV